MRHRSLLRLLHHAEHSERIEVVADDEVAAGQAANLEGTSSLLRMDWLVFAFAVAQALALAPVFEIAIEIAAIVLALVGFSVFAQLDVASLDVAPALWAVRLIGIHEPRSSAAISFLRNSPSSATEATQAKPALAALAALAFAPVLAVASASAARGEQQEELEMLEWTAFRSASLGTLGTIHSRPFGPPYSP